jgi:hypothetical protein
MHSGNPKEIKQKFKRHYAHQKVGRIAGAICSVMKGMKRNGNRIGAGSDKEKTPRKQRR